MHELSIANSILESVLRETERQAISGVSVVGLRIGELSGVLPDALIFGFDALKTDTALASAKIEIENVPVKAKCNTCSVEFRVDKYVFICPACKSGRVEMICGQEVEIAYLGVEEEHAAEQVHQQ